MRACVCVGWRARTLQERLADTQRDVDKADAEHRASSIKLKLLNEQLASSNKVRRAAE